MILPLLVFATQTVARGAVQAAQCGRCHAREAATIGDSPMTRAAERPVDSPFLKDNSELTFHIGKFTYSVKQQSGRSVYSVTDGTNTLSSPIGWAIGKGLVGQTWLVEMGGVLYEGAVSYYPGAKALDLTPGHAELPAVLSKKRSAESSIPLKPNSASDAMPPTPCGGAQRIRSPGHPGSSARSATPKHCSTPWR